MTLDTLNQLLWEELSDLYSAEQQIIKALPRMVKAATHPELKKAFEEHLRVTEQQVSRLEDIFERLEGKKPRKSCKAMQGIIEEGKEITQMDGEPAVLDAALIGAAQRVEHYEIAGYGCARTYAEILGDEETAELLQATLDEEKETDERLNALAMEVINQQAADAGDDEDEEDDDEE